MGAFIHYGLQFIGAKRISFDLSINPLAEILSLYFICAPFSIFC